MANLLSTIVSGRLSIGSSSTTPYLTEALDGIVFGGNEVGYAYRLYTQKENYGGDYTKLNIAWHTGIKIGAYYGYGGIRFYNNSPASGTEVFSVAKGDSHVRVENNLYVGNTIYNNGNAVIHSGNIGSQSVNYANTAGTAGSANTFQGYTAYNLIEEARGVHSGSDFPNGTLVTTDINASEWAGASFVMEVSGKSYDGSQSPFKLIMQGYLYADTVINVSAMSYSSYFPAPVKVMNLNGNLAFWWPRGSYWNSFEVHVRDAGGSGWNRVTGISDSVDPAEATKKVSCTPIQVIHTNNIGSQSVNYAASAGTSTTSTHLSARTDSEWYNVIWGAGNPSYMYSSDSIRIRSSDGALRANIYYDNNDTTYYLDPSSTTSIRTAGSWRSDSSAWDGEYAGKIQYHGNWWYFQSLNGWIFRRENGVEPFTFNQNGNLNIYGNSNAPINITGSSDKYITINPGNGYEAMVRYVGGSGSSWYVGKRMADQLVNTASFHFYSEAAGATVGGITIGGDMYASGSMRAPIFYDSQDTTYYGDFASLSRVNEIGANKMRADTNGDYATDKGWWSHDPYGQGWGKPHGSFRSLEVSTSGNFDTEPAMFRIHQWGSGAAEFWKPKGTTLYLRETPGGGSGWFTRFEVQGSTYVTSSMQAYSYQGHSNVAGTGNASYHPSGIYSTGTNWLYGTMYMNDNSIRDVKEVYNNGWFRTVGHQGIYNPTNDAHFYPNNASYGSWRIDGTRNGWHGLHFNSGSTLMMNSAETGVHREGYGWQFRWYNGSMFVSRGTYGGGTEYTVIDSGTIGSQSVNYATSAGNSSTTSQIVFNDLKTNFPSGAGGGHSFAANHYSMGLDSGNGGWDHPHYRDVIIGYHTGIRFGAAYSGIRFYNNSPTTDANNDGNGDSGESLLMTIGGYVGTANGTDVVVNNNLFANVSMRAPIFYDSNDTNYYLDPTSTGTALRISGGIVSTAGNGAVLLKHENSEANAWIFRENAANWGLFWLNAGNQSGQSIGSYTTVGAELFGMNNAVTGFNPSSAWSGTDASTRAAWMLSSYSGYLWTQGTQYSETDMRAPIFYDSADTGYSWNPNTTNAHRFSTPNGYVDIGPMNGSWCHFQTDRPRFYFGNSVTVDGDLKRYSDSALYIHSANYNSYAPTLTGGGASGSWAISVTGSAGGVAWGNVSSKPSRWLNATNLIEDNAPDTTTESGFWQSYLGSGNPTGTWFNYVNVRHSNPANVHGYQIGMSYYDNNLWFRSYQGNGTYQTWSRALGTNTDPYPSNMNQYVRTTDDVTHNSTTSPLFLVNGHSDNTKGYRIHNTSGSSVSAMFTNSSNQLVIAAGAVDQINLNKKVLVNAVALGVNIAPSATAGRIDASNDIVAYSSSDERLKENITPIANALDKVKSLTGVEFDWKPEHKEAHGHEGHDTGIIAQQVLGVMPTAVRTNDTGYLAVRYEKLIGLLIEANKELAARVEELEKKIG